MTEYTRIHNELKSLGWMSEQGKGDHVIYRKEGKDNIVVSMQVSRASRAYQNCLADIRSKEPGFTLGRPAKKKIVTEPVPADSEPVQDPYEQISCQPAKTHDKEFIRKMAWLSVGTKAVTKENPEQICSVTRIESEDGEKVFDEADIIHLLSESGEELQAFPEDLDSAKQMKCCVCGRYRPLNWFGSWYKSEEKRNTCSDCINNKTTEMEKTNNAYADEMARNISEDMLEGISKSFAGQDFKSMRECNRKIESSAERMIEKIKAKIRTLDFSKIDTSLLILALADKGVVQKDEQGKIYFSVDEIDSFLEAVSSESLIGILKKRNALPETQASQKSLEEYDSQALFDELKRRGFKIVDGKFKRIIEETLE